MMGKDFLPSLSLDRVLYEHTHSRACVSSLEMVVVVVALESLQFDFCSFSLVQSLCPLRFCPSAVRPDTRDQKKTLGDFYSFPFNI